MRVRIDTLGCRVNRYDSAEIRGELAARGFEVVDEGAPFDLYVLNTCTVTHQADAEARGLISRIRRGAPDARIAVTGCWAQTSPDEVRKLPVDLVVGNVDKARLPELLGAGEASAEIFPDGGGATRFFFKVQEGCDVRCTFCIIPDARGHSRSLEPDRIVSTLQRARERGYREAILAGIHLGAYGRDLPAAPPLAGLCRRVLDETGIERLRLGSLEPWGVRKDLIDLFRDEPRFLPMLHLPLQSGSERILRAMRRPISAASYRKTVDALFNARPDLALYLDVLVGFPGETDADFEDTLRFLDGFPWTKLHVFPYSPRRGTPAAELPDQVAPEVKKSRVRTLVDLSDARFSQRLAARVGSRDEVLVEDNASGHTRDHFPCRIANAQPGDIVPVRLVGTIDTDGAARILTAWPTTASSISSVI